MIHKSNQNGFFIKDLEYENAWIYIICDIFKSNKMKIL
jgi:hypothetical protein